MLKKSSKYEAGDWVVDKFTGERGMVLIARPSDLTDCMVVQLNGKGRRLLHLKDSTEAGLSHAERMSIKVGQGCHLAPNV